MLLAFRRLEHEFLFRLRCLLLHPLEASSEHARSARPFFPSSHTGFASSACVRSCSRF